MNYLTFSCPDCGHARLEEVITDVTITSKITSISLSGRLRYGDHKSTDGDTLHYQCSACGYVINHKGRAIREQRALAKELKRLAQNPYVSQSAPAIYRELAGKTMAEVEADMIRATLTLCDNNRRRTADMLGMGNRTLYRKLNLYKIE